MSPRTAISIYRRLLRLLPEPHRREAEEEMLEVFRDAFQETAGRGGVLAGTRFWWRMLVDVAATSAYVRWRSGGRPAPLRIRSGGRFHGLAGDVRGALRSARTRPGWSALVVATLGLGIGANTVIFSVWNAFLLKPLPFAGEELDRLVAPFALQGDDPFQVSPFDARQWRESARSFDELGLARPASLNTMLDGEPRRLSAAVVTPSYLDALGVSALAGRSFREEDVRGGARPLVLLSHALWRSAFGAEPSAVGGTMRLDGAAYEVVGVLPPGFDLPFGTDLWLPLAIEDLSEEERIARDYFAVGRLREDVARREAESELRTIASRLARELPDSHAGWSVELVPLRHFLLDDLDSDLAASLRAMLAAVGLFLLIACANVANLLLVRIRERERELALRSALGAGRGRLARQLLVEGLVLGAAGGALGLALASFTVPAVVALSPVQPLALASSLRDASFDARVFGFAAALCLSTGLALGLLPAWRASRPSPSAFRDDGGRASPSAGQRLWMRRLVVAETALAVALLVSAGLVLDSFGRLRGQGLGFRPDDVVIARLGLSPAAYPAHAGRNALVGAILSRVRALPDVTAAGVTTNVPLDHLSWDAAFTQRGGAPVDPRRLQLTADRLVSPGYLEALSVPLVAGRRIQESDTADAERVVVVTKDLAEKAWPGQDPIGKLVKRGRLEGDGPWLRVVGVVSETKEDRSAFRRARPAWYVPYGQIDNERPVTLVVRTAGGPSSIAGALRAALAEIDPELPVHGVTTLDAQVADFLAQERFGAVLIGFFAAFGLILAGLGVYGVLSHAASSRRHEIGVRMALGADGRRVRALIVLDGARAALTGLALGWILAALAGPLLGSLLFEVHPLDPKPYLLAAAVSVGAALLASFLPARRATAIDPLRALREP